MDHLKIAMVDDDKLVLNLLCEYLNNSKDFEIILKTTSGPECISALSKDSIRPDIFILDLSMEDMDGIELTKKIQKHLPESKIIILSSHYKSNFTGFMLKLGVSAFIPKGITAEKLKEIILEVNTKGFYFIEEQVKQLGSQISSKAPKPILDARNLLSEREEEILKLICAQKTAKEIGSELFITQRTVEGHKNNLFAKSGARNMAGLVIFAIQSGIIDINDFPFYN